MNLALIPTDLLKQELLKLETLSRGLEIDLHGRHDSLPLVFQLKLLVDTALSKLEANS